jgi:acyl-coenzyme A synthetase/AMP-(fatty) acid ligase
LRADPAAPAIIDAVNGRVWARADLMAAADEWLAANPAREQLARIRVAIAEPNGVSWWIVFLALLKAHAVPVLLDSTEPAANQIRTARGVGAAWICRGAKVEATGASGRVAPRDTCLVKLTSGSTGVPVARPFTHAQMLADGRQICTTMGIGPADINLAVIPLGHSYGLGNIVVPLLAQGTAAVCAGSPLPHALAADAARWRPTVFPAVPTLLRALVRTDVEPKALESVRTVISAGAPLPPEIATAFEQKFGRRVHGFYGTTETGGISFDRSGEATLEGRSVGTPMEGVRIEFQRGRRFRVQSAAVGGRGMHRPSDRAELNDFGELVLLGRAGRIIKIAGRRLDLAEVETALKALPGVRDAFAAPAAGRTDAIAAAVCTDRAAGQLRDEAKARLAPWKVPHRWLVLREFPSTPRGKTDTRRLARLLESKTRSGASA